MSSVRALLAGGGGVLCTAIAVVGLNHLVNDYERQLEHVRSEPDRVTVAVASQDLYQGVPIVADDLHIVQVEPRYLPEGSFFRPESVVGRIPRERILADELVRADRLADPEAGIGLNALIPRGTRAISIEIADGAALSGMLMPGSWVDVLVTLEQEEDPPETHTLLQATYVLGVNRRLSGETRNEAKDRRGGGKPAVTLLVAVSDAERIAHASMMGDIRLTLRNGLDDAMNDMEGADKCDLRGGCDEAEAAPAPKRPERIDERCYAVDQVHGEEKVLRWFTPEGLPCDL